jgi:pilus assembly protein CpaD
MSCRALLCDLKRAVRIVGAVLSGPILLALPLASCGGASDLPPAEMPKAIHVEHVRVQYDAAFAPGTADLPPAQAAGLDNFLDRSNVRPSDPVYVATAAGDPLAAERGGRVALLLARRGLAAVSIAPPPSGVLPNHVLVLADRYVATPPACPDWSDDPSGSHSNVTSSNYGCATMTDLSLMIDNPRDLVTGRELGPAAGDPAADAMARYRTGTVKPFGGGAASGSAAPSGSSSGGSASGGSASGGSQSGGAGDSSAAAAASSVSTSPSATMLNGAVSPQVQ